MDGDGGDDGGDERCDEEGVQTMDTLNMMVERLQKMATDDFGDAGDKEALDALRELNNKWTEHFGEEATTRCFPSSREAITTSFLPRVLRPPVRNICPLFRRVEKTETPDPKPLEPAVDRSQPPSTDAGRLVVEYVSNTGYMASENRTVEMAEDGALDLVNNDLVHNNAVTVENVEQDLVNNDSVKIDLVNKDAVNVEIVEQDLVIGELVNTDAVNVDVDGEKDKDKDVDTVNSNNTVGFGQQRTYETNSNHTGLFIGNIPLQSCPIPAADDKIADGFNNSSRGKLLRSVTFWERDHTFIMSKNMPCPSGLAYVMLRPPRTDSTSSIQDSGIYGRSNRRGTVVVPRATNCTATVGTENDAAKIKTYTGPSLDKIEIFAGRIVDGGRPEHGGQWNWQTPIPGCDYKSIHEIGLRSCMRDAG
ncbi:UNVERIFIED_CONTAM: hypothetical protein Sindi_2918000, partial [Sesamum indicum]